MNVKTQAFAARCVAFNLLLMLSGCASTHNFSSDGHNAFGGGFSEHEITPGLYELTAVSNFSPWPSFSAAKSTWKGRADTLCGRDSYQEIVSGQSEGLQGNTMVYVPPSSAISVPRYNASISGLILCNRSGMTVASALKYIDDLKVSRALEVAAKHKKELQELGGANCSEVGAAESGERLFRRGKILVAMSEYKLAMLCFMRAKSAESDTAIHRAACFEIATMYELGWGVEKNIATAMTWFRKAGL
ncbi:MAG: hypothetical protein ACKVOO_04070 [Burkholderiaceae bacterium]